MKFLVIVQDLRISGTSEGIVSRSFISKLKKCYPQSTIEVLYLKNHQNEDHLELLPLDRLEQHYIDRKISPLTKFINRFYWRITHKSLNESSHIAKYTQWISAVDSDAYDHVFIRSSGLQFETILGAAGLPVLKKAIINFHDAFPVLWDTGSLYPPTNLELFRFKKMWKVVQEAKACMSPSTLLSQDLQFLYGTTRFFYTLPHQFEETAFKIEPTTAIRKKAKKITISYHGAIQFARNMDVVIDAYLEIVNENSEFRDTTEFVIRARGSKSAALIKKYKNAQNIYFIDTIDFGSAAYEQIHETNIVIILENCAAHSNILVGKAPFLAYLKKPVLSLSPHRSEMRRILDNKHYVAHCADKEEVKEKLKNLIAQRLQNNEDVTPFKDYFSDQHFKAQLDHILKNSGEN